MSRNSYYSELLGSKVYSKQPLFIVDLDLDPAPALEVSGGYQSDDSSYYTIKKNVNLRRGFIRALHLASDNSYEILRAIFLDKIIITQENNNMNYNYLDGKVNGKVLDFPMIESIDIGSDMAKLYADTKGTIIYKTYNKVNELVKFWYKFLGIDIADLSDEIYAMKEAGFIIQSELVPVDSNPLGIKFITISH